MKLDIARWCKKACQRYPHLKLHAFYDGHENTYYIHTSGKVVMVFSEYKFFEIDPNYRLFKMIQPLLKVGMHNNLGNPGQDVMVNNKLGIEIC